MTKLLPLLLLVPLAGCAARATTAGEDAGSRRTVPLVDHHQHIMGARMIGPQKPAPADIELPGELARVLEARNAVMQTGEAGNVFTADALIFEPFAGVWMTGEEGIEEIAGMYTSDSRFFANGFTLGEDVAVITGVMRSGEYRDDEMHVTFGLERGADGWRIASEHASVMPLRMFTEEITAEHLIRTLDDVGIERAVVLSVAYWAGEPDETYETDEYELTRAENDWTAAQVARYPERLVAFCGIAPVRPYAEAEVRRCASELGVTGIKMHFRSNDVNIKDPAQASRIRRVFEVANELGLAIVVHSETDPDFGPYDAEEARIFLDQFVSAAPDVVIQIAHLFGGDTPSEEALAVYADAVASGDPRARNLYFDLAYVAQGAARTEEGAAMVARYARRIGMDRLLYGSDATPSPDMPPSTLGWGMLRRALPLTDAEFADIADNVAPYLR